jgi:hypothetical protein
MEEKWLKLLDIYGCWAVLLGTITVSLVIIRKLWKEVLESHAREVEMAKRSNEIVSQILGKTGYK